MIAPQQHEPCSVYADCEAEALRFKWLESEKAGYDLGEEALRWWSRRHWKDYIRARLIEHLEGKRFWSELDLNDFGLLKRVFQDDAFLLDRIIDRLRCGGENLQIIVWACDWGIPMGRVHSILETININARRLRPHFDSEA